MHICKQFGHILGEMLERKIGLLASRLGSGLAIGTLSSSNTSFPTKKALQTGSAGIECSCGGIKNVQGRPL